MIQTAKIRWPLAEAQVVAEDVAALLRPWCDRIQVAGSIRRGRSDVGDVELLVVPTPGVQQFLPDPANDQVDLFGMPLVAPEAPPEPPCRGDSVDVRVKQLMADGVVALRPNKKGRHSYGGYNKLLVHVDSGIPIDIFSTTSANWGMSLLVRTGPRDFNIRLMKRLKDRGLRGHAYGGITLDDGTSVSVPTEERCFEIAGLPWVRPEERK